MGFRCLGFRGVGVSNYLGPYNTLRFSLRMLLKVALPTAWQSGGEANCRDIETGGAHTDLEGQN